MIKILLTNQRIIIFFIFLGVLIGGGYLFTKIDTKTKTKVIDNRTLKDMLNEGKSLKCVFRGLSKKTILEATIYLYDQKIREEITSVGPNNTQIITQIIIKDNYSYLWNNVEEKGYIFDQTQQETLAPIGDSDDENLNRIANYNCQDWQEENSLFEIPTDRKFQDINQTTPSL
jgi:hypothetical protein